jgi:trehalose 6-phosphate synthase
MRAYAAFRQVPTQELIQLARRVAGGRRLLVASNRGPIQHVVERDGGLRAQRGAGGVVTALSALKDFLPITWVASAMSEGDRRVAAQWDAAQSAGSDELAIRFVAVPRRTFHQFYDIIANPLLWFLQHYMWDPAFGPDVDASVHEAWDRGYCVVNQAFADTLVDEVNRSGAPFVMLHDYHLYLAPRFIRQKLPGAVLQHFIHIPWPDPYYWTLISADMRTAIFAGLCANDIVGFQTPRFAENFMQGCRMFLPDAQVAWEERTTTFRGHRTLARSYPISIDTNALQHTMRTALVRRHVERLRAYCGEQTVVRVERVEPSKNILRGFKALDLLLRRHREHRGRVKMLAFLVPSRTSIREYKRYTHEVMRHIEEVNLRHATPEWRPIELFYENNYAQALAGMSLYDVLLVNPIIDGMNLVAKEGPTVNTRDGVLILSEGAGAYEQLQGGALPVAATDVEGTVIALHMALTMPAEERARRAAYLRARVAEEDLTHWLLWQLRDLESLLQVGRGTL